jgi:hypothetical protein
MRSKSNKSGNRNEATSLSMDNVGYAKVKLNFDQNAISLGDQAKQYKL